MFITLRYHDTAGEYLLNPHYIVVVEKSTTHSGSLILLAGHRPFDALETPEMIEKLVDDAMSPRSEWHLE